MHAGSLDSRTVMGNSRSLGMAMTNQQQKRNSTPCSIQRSQEVMPSPQKLAPQRLHSGSLTTTDIAGSLNSISSSEGSS